MQNEPIQINLKKTPAHARISPGSPEQKPSADILDAAFDEYRRVDVVASPTSAARSEAAGMTKALIADISTQLDILERQREQLTALLRDVNL